jgi:hypothetical protein
MTYGGEGWFGNRHSPESRCKMSQTRKGKSKPPRSPETRIKLSQANKGKKRTPAMIERMREIGRQRFSGSSNPMFGHKHTDAARIVMSDQAKQRIGDKNPNYGNRGDKNPISRRWLLLSPTGEQVEVIGLQSFCKEHSFQPTTIVKTLHTQKPVVKGPAKGWRLLNCSPQQVSIPQE